MADDAEVLDWGGEDDEHFGHNRTATANDVDDVVSIGGEEDDMQELAAFHSRTMRDTEKEKTPPARVKPPEMESGKKSPQRNSGAAEAQPTAPFKNVSELEVPLVRKSSRRRSRSPSRSVKVPPLIHALPPKPVVAAVPSTRSSSFMEASSMTNLRRSQEGDSSRRRANGSKPVFSDALPPDWETRHSSAGEPYFYNIRTHVSQWDRPVLNGKAASPDPTAYDRDIFSDPRGENKLDRTKSSGDLRSDRIPEPQIYKSMERTRPASPVQKLSYDDRHYRPSNGVDIAPRDLQREQRDPLSSNQDVPKEPLSVQGKVHSERDVSRTVGQRSDVDDERPHRRPSEPREVPSVPRNVVKEDDRRLVPRVPWPDRERSRASRHDEGTAKGVRTGQQGFTDDRRGGTLYSANDFKEPPPRSGDVAPPSAHRRYRSRSASPPLLGSTSLRDRNDMTPEYNDSISRRDFHPRVPGNVASGPSLPANVAEQHSRWDSPLLGHRDSGRPPDLDPPARRPRERDPASSTDMGSDAKRRRIDRVTADEMGTPRGRPSSTMDMRGDFYRPDSYTDALKPRTERRGNNNDGIRSSGVAPSFESARQDDYSFSKRSGPPDFIKKPRDPGFDSGPISGGPLPSGPRGKAADQRDVDVESRGYFDDRWPTPAEHSTYQQADRQSKRDGRDLRGRRSEIGRVPHDNRAPSTLEPMDVDDARLRTSGVSSKASDIRDDHNDKQESIDQLPTGPRAMHSRGAPPLPSSHLTSPDAHRAVTPPESPRYDGRRSSTAGLRGRRGTRFDDSADDQRSLVHFGKDDSQDGPLHRFDTGNEHPGPRIRQSLEPGNRSEVLHPDDWLPSERVDIPNAPRFRIRQQNTRRPPSPKLTGANNVPVPGRKSWTVDSNIAAIPASFDGAQSARSDERRRRPLENDRSDELGRGVVSPESTYGNLHGDVEYKMSLSDRKEVTVNNHFSNRGSERKVDEPVKQRDNLPPTSSQNTRVSRFSTQADDRLSHIRANDGPRIWLPRDAAESSRAVGSDEGRVPNLPRSAGGNRSNAGSSTHKLSPNGHPLGVDSHRDSSAQEREDSRPDTTSSTSGISPRLRSTGGLREVHDGTRRSTHLRDAPYQRQNPVDTRGSSELDPTRHSDSRAGRLPKAFQEMSGQGGQGLHNSVGPVQPSRSSKLAPAGGQSEIDQQAGHRNDPPTEEPSSSQTSALFIRRPNTKPEYEAQQSMPPEFSRSEVQQMGGQQGHGRPSQLRSNSLLNRLSMNAEAIDSGASEGSHPALRDRIGQSRRFGNSDSGWDNAARSPKDSPRREDSNIDHTEGYKSRSHGRGRGRTNRSRRRTRQENASQKEKQVLS